MDPDAEFRTWNVFRRRHDDALCCAVSAEAPVPAFLLSGEWDFGFAFSEGDPPLAGFSAAAAEVGTGFNGFYLFLAFTAPNGAAARGAAPSSGRH